MSEVPVVFYSRDTSVNGYMSVHGTNSYVLVTANSGDWSFGYNPFTIDFWAYLNSTSYPTQCIWTYGVVNSRLWVGVENNSLSLHMFDGTNPIWFMCLYSGSINTWNHIAIVREGTNIAKTNSGWYFFINGNSQPITKLGSYDWNTSMPYWAGNSRFSGDFNSYWWYTGFLDEFRISNTARWISNFNPGSWSSLTNYSTDGNTLLLNHFDGTASDSTLRHTMGTVQNVDFSVQSSESNNPVPTFKVWNTYVSPSTSGQMDLGSSGLKFSNVYIKGTGFFEAITCNAINTNNGELKLSATGSGIAIGQDTSQKVGFYGITPITQQVKINTAIVGDTAGMVTAINNIIYTLNSLGLITP